MGSTPEWSQFTVMVRPEAMRALEDLRWERRVRSVGMLVREAIDTYLAAHSSDAGDQPASTQSE